MRTSPLSPDLCFIRGHPDAKLALAAAAAGGHNLLLTGPSGTGKTVLASCLQGLLVSPVPFRAPPFSSSWLTLATEITLAHGGVLFLDDLDAFAPKVLRSLKGPLETGEVAMLVNEKLTTREARFQL